MCNPSRLFLLHSHRSKYNYVKNYGEGFTVLSFKAVGGHEKRTEQVSHAGLGDDDEINCTQ
jgi:hypothetical protein